MQIKNAEQAGKRQSFVKPRRVRMSAKKIGELGELAFRLRASILGFSVARLDGECEHYDSLVDNGRRCLRVQVKTSISKTSRHFYSVSCARTRFDRKKRANVAVPYEKGDIDFLAIYILPEDTWYIVPFEVLRGRVQLTIHAAEHAKPGELAKYKNAWHLLWKGSGARGAAKRASGLVIDRIMACADEAGESRGTGDEVEAKFEAGLFLVTRADRWRRSVRRKKCHQM